MTDGAAHRAISEGARLLTARKQSCPPTATVGAQAGAMDVTTRIAPHTWLLRVELDDRPGALARVTTRLAARDCNVLGLSVLPVPGGVVDELVVRTPEEVTPAALVADIRAEGGRCVGLTPAD